MFTVTMETASGVRVLDPDGRGSLPGLLRVTPGSASAWLPCSGSTMCPVLPQNQPVLGGSVALGTLGFLGVFPLLTRQDSCESLSLSCCNFSSNCEASPGSARGDRTGERTGRTRGLRQKLQGAGCGRTGPGTGTRMGRFWRAFNPCQDGR